VSNDPAGNMPANSPSVDLWIEDTPSASLSSQAVSMVGGSRSHTNMMPYLCVHFIVALFGIYPSRQ
jgi:microcystin-dependent protein